MTFRIGQMNTKPYQFDAAGIVAFAKLAGDDNPLHHDEVAARASRFGGLIAGGTQMSAVLMAFGASMLSRDHEAVGLEFNFRFVKAIAAGTQATLRWTITSVEPHAKLGGTLVGFEGAITSEGVIAHVLATGRVVVWDKRVQSL